jgi:hypothetical protein
VKSESEEHESKQYESRIVTDEGRQIDFNEEHFEKA